MTKLQVFRPNNRDDVILWMLENDGFFLVLSPLLVLVAKKPTLNRPSPILIWKARCPEKVKVKVFVWIFSS